MTTLIKVYAVPGRRFSLPGRRGEFVGYERVPGGSADDAAFTVPNGSSYVLRPDGEDVPNTIDVRRGLASGDITDRAPDATEG